jgi:hypothetical protein
VDEHGHSRLIVAVAFGLDCFVDSVYRGGSFLLSGITHCVRSCGIPAPTKWRALEMVVGAQVGADMTASSLQQGMLAE